MALKSYKNHQKLTNEIKELEIEIRMIAPRGEEVLEEELSKIPKIENDFEEYSKLNKEELETSLNLAKNDFEEKEIEKIKSTENLKGLINKINVNTAQIDLTASNLTKVKQSLSDFVLIIFRFRFFLKYLIDISFLKRNIKMLT